MKTIKCRVIQGSVMPDGWHFFVPEMKTPIRAETFPGLITAVIEYRISNNLPIGDVLAEVEEQICGRHPHQCHAVSGATVVVTTEVKQSNRKRELLDRIIRWFEAQTKRLDASILVLTSEAQRRAKICERCPYNQDWRIGCAPCADNINRLSKVVRQGHHLPADKKLRGCAILGHENRAAVHLQLNRLETSDKIPAHCWCKQG